MYISRNIENDINNQLEARSNRIILLSGARQTGKTTILENIDTSKKKLMINFWDEELVAGSGQQFEVYVINDDRSSWAGAVSFAIARSGETVAQQSSDCSVDGLGREILSFVLTVPDQAGEYQLVAELVTADGNEIRSLRDFKIVSVK